MTFLDYVKRHGYPDKVICFSSVNRYVDIRPKDFNVPVVLGMSVDHVEFSVDGKTSVAFLRCPSDVQF